jgi:glycosyltransferase 2 family protein
MDKQKLYRLAKFAIRWGIAVFGIVYVISRMSWHDHVWGILPGQTHAQLLQLAEPSAGDGDAVYQVVDPSDKSATISLPAAAIVPQPNTPRVQIGVRRMIGEARVPYILAALAVFPITIIITSARWHELLKVLDVRLPFARTFVLNFVGLFYSTFMLGSTGGDVLKAYYVARQTHHRMRAVMSVAVDRVIGLVALIILGGVMATLQWHIPTCRKVAKASALLVGITGAGLIVFYAEPLRKGLGVDWILSRLPMQKHVKAAIETMHLYGRRPFVSLGALLISFPVHMTVITSAMLAGFAFNLPIHPFYYWMAVPVIVLAGSIPISPQGAGVMEYFAIKLLEGQGVNVGQAFALTMSIRLTQMIWNLAGGVFVLRGGYHKPSASEQQQVEAEDEDEQPSERSSV